MADRLRATVGESVTLARLGGDTFVAVVPGPTDVTAVLRLANRIRSSVGAAARGGRPDGGAEPERRHHRGPPGDDPDDVIGRGEQAMAHAKRSGGDRTEVFDDALAEADSRRQTIDQQLRRALEEDGLRVHYQPVVDIETDQVVAAEALLRVHDDDGVVLSPAEFIEAAESNGSDLAARPAGAPLDLRAAGGLDGRSRRPRCPPRCR